MLKDHHAPHEVAAGVAAGSFIAILPLYGFHTLLCLAVAILMPKVNKLAILAGSSISIPPTVGIITWTAYDIGRFLLPDKHYPPLSWEYIWHFQIQRISEFYYPLFIGSIYLGLMCAMALYLLTFLAVERFSKNRPVRPPAQELN